MGSCAAALFLLYIFFLLWFSSCSSTACLFLLHRLLLGENRSPRLPRSPQSLAPWSRLFRSKIWIAEREGMEPKKMKEPMWMSVCGWDDTKLPGSFPPPERPTTPPKRKMCMRRQATLRATRQLYEQEGEGSRSRLEKPYRLNGDVDIPAAHWSLQEEMEKCQMRDFNRLAALQPQHPIVDARDYKPHDNMNDTDGIYPSHLARAMKEDDCRHKQREAEEKAPKVEKELEDDWVIVSDDFGVLVFLDEF
ncbi:hypothetical protein V8C35DRAFT_314821 [Trichoderma chlorosporum]